MQWTSEGESVVLVPAGDGPRGNTRPFKLDVVDSGMKLLWTFDGDSYVLVRR